MSTIPTIEARQVIILWKLYIQRTHEMVVCKFLVKTHHTYDQRVLSFMHLILDKAIHEYSGTLSCWDFFKHSKEHHSSDVMEEQDCLVKCIYNFNPLSFRKHQIILNIVIHYELFQASTSNGRKSRAHRVHLTQLNLLDRKFNIQEQGYSV